MQMQTQSQITLYLAKLKSRIDDGWRSRAP